MDGLAEEIAAEVDRLLAARWSRKEGAILEPDVSPAAVSTAACACGSGVPVTTVQIDGRSVEIMALAPILELAYEQGLRADGALPDRIIETVRVYNAIPAGDETLWEQGVTVAWRDFCAGEEKSHGA